MVSKWLRIIPTPQFFVEGKRRLLLTERGKGIASLQTGASEMEKLAGDCLIREVDALVGAPALWAGSRSGVPVFIGAIQDAAIGPQLKTRLDGEDLDLLARDATSQAYVLRVEVRGTAPAVVVAGASPLGALYGVMTLLQLLSHAGGNVSVPEVHIRDYPDFKQRAAADWLLFNEISRWGYDWGDGEEAYTERVKRKLDFCLRYKINMVYADGFSWNPERFPGYADLMRELNRYSRRRGIKLVFGGYGMGYGASGLVSEAAYGPAFENRRTYPDGQIYECMGWEGAGRSREMGTCLSNQALQELKLENLRQFVRVVHPGALYIHHLDADTYAEAERIWSNRCEQCRSRWPNDSYKEEDGAVGAFAHWYDKICEAVFGVEDEDYVASRDCTVILVSPCYTAYRESDEDWDNAVQFWAKVSNRMLYHDNVQVGLREQFLRYDNNGKRIEEMASALSQTGEGLTIHVIAFGGADRFRNDQLFLATPVMNGMYQGAEAVYNCCGHVHQEVLQVLNAEYCWNARPGFHDIPEESHVAVSRFEAYLRGELRPAAIFGKGGFLDESCRRLYGEAAGPRLSKVFDLRTAEGLTPVAVAFGSVDKGLPGRIGPLTHEKAEQLAREWRGRLKVSEIALAEVKLALKGKGLPRGVDEDLDWLRKGLEMGVGFARVLHELYACLTKAGGRKPAPKAFPARTVPRLQRLEALLQQILPRETICPLGADIQVWRECLAALKQAIGKPPASLLQTSEEQHQWW